MEPATEAEYKYATWGLKLMDRLELGGMVELIFIYAKHWI